IAPRRNISLEPQDFSGSRSGWTAAGADESQVDRASVVAHRGCPRHLEGHVLRWSGEILQHHDDSWGSLRSRLCVGGARSDGGGGAAGGDGERDLSCHEQSVSHRPVQSRADYTGRINKEGAGGCRPPRSKPPETTRRARRLVLGVALVAEHALIRR